MNLRKIFLIMTLCFFSSNLIYSMEDEITGSGAPRLNLLEAMMKEEASGVAPHEAMQFKDSEAQSPVEKIKREISNLNLIAIGYLLESDEATTVTAQERQTLYKYALSREAEISRLLEEGHAYQAQLQT